MISIETHLGIILTEVVEQDAKARRESPPQFSQQDQTYKGPELPPIRYNPELICNPDRTLKPKE